MKIPTLGKPGTETEDTESAINRGRTLNTTYKEEMHGVGARLWQLLLSTNKGIKAN